jgi:hypothetical protein
MSDELLASIPSEGTDFTALTVGEDGFQDSPMLQAKLRLMDQGIEEFGVSLRRMVKSGVHFQQHGQLFSHSSGAFARRMLDAVRLTTPARGGPTLGGSTNSGESTSGGSSSASTHGGGGGGDSSSLAEGSQAVGLCTLWMMQCCLTVFCFFCFS